MSRLFFPARSRRTWLALLAAVACVVLGSTASTQRQRFYRDDPISREPDSQDASAVALHEIKSIYEMTYNLFVIADHKPSGVRAQNINTIDELPDSNWFTNRIGTTPITPEQMTRGANVGAPPDPSKWILTREKTAGVHPGFTARDGKGETWFLQFDPPYYDEGATGAVAVASRMFWALGYNQVELFLTTFDPKNVEFDPKATIRRPSGQRTRFNRDDMNAILERVAKKPDGTYRVVAGRLLPGKILGGYLFQGTRPDDPNDVVPHEHRRDLRALRVFGAWTNLTDLKAANTLDTLVSENGRMVVKHYLQDVGSTFGMCNELYEWDLSYEHFYQADTTWKRLFSFGFALSPWQTIPYKEYYPSVGKFEGDEFDPKKWKPQTPTTAYMEARADDAFWAARRIAAFSDELIRAAVRAGQYSDPKAEQYLGDVLIKRRDKILALYLTAVNPIVTPRLDASGRLTIENAAIAAGVAKGQPTYRASWMLFDNATGDTKPLSTTESQTTTLTAPAGLPTTPGSYIQVDISADLAAFPTWKQPIKTHFRRTAQGWELVGLERLPETVPAAQTLQAES
jgi:hypothetical protein